MSVTLFERIPWLRILRLAVITTAMLRFLLVALKISILWITT